MKKIFFTLLGVFLSFNSKVFASWDTWILWGWGMTKEKIRSGDIHTDDIPGIIKWATDYLMWFAATIAIIFIIIWAYKIALWSLEWDKSAGKKTIMLALWGFILASLSWVILKFIIDNFS